MDCVVVGQHPMGDPHHCDLVIGSKCELGFEPEDFLGYDDLAGLSPVSKDSLDSDIVCLSKSILPDTGNVEVEDTYSDSSDKPSWPCCAEDNLHLTGDRQTEICSEQDQLQGQYYPEVSMGHLASEATEHTVTNYSTGNEPPEVDSSGGRGISVIAQNEYRSGISQEQLLQKSQLRAKPSDTNNVHSSAASSCQETPDDNNLVISKVWSQALPIPVPVSVKDNLQTCSPATYSQLRGLADKVFQDISKENSSKSRSRKAKAKRATPSVSQRISVAVSAATAHNKVVNTMAPSVETTKSMPGLESFRFKPHTVHHHDTRDRNHFTPGCGSISLGIPLLAPPHAHSSYHVNTTNVPLNPNYGLLPQDSNTSMSSASLHNAVPGMEHYNTKLDPKQHVPVNSFGRDLKHLEGTPPLIRIEDILPQSMKKFAGSNNPPKTVYQNFPQVKNTYSNPVQSIPLQSSFYSGPMQNVRRQENNNKRIAIQRTDHKNLQNANVPVQKERYRSNVNSMVLATIEPSSAAQPNVNPMVLATMEPSSPTRPNVNPMVLATMEPSSPARPNVNPMVLATMETSGPAQPNVNPMVLATMETSGPARPNVNPMVLATMKPSGPAEASPILLEQSVTTMTDESAVHKTKSGMKLKSYWKDLHESKGSPEISRKRTILESAGDEIVWQKELRAGPLYRNQPQLLQNKSDVNGHVLEQFKETHTAYNPVTRERDAGITQNQQQLPHTKKNPMRMERGVGITQNQPQLPHTKDNPVRWERSTALGLANSPSPGASSTHDRSRGETPLPKMPPLIPIYSLFAASDSDMSDDVAPSESCYKSYGLSNTTNRELGAASTFDHSRSSDKPTGCITQHRHEASQRMSRSYSDTSVISSGRMSDDRWTSESPALSLSEASSSSGVVQGSPIIPGSKEMDSKALGVHLALQYRLWKNFMDFGVNDSFQHNMEDTSCPAHDKRKTDKALSNKADKDPGNCAHVASTTERSDNLSTTNPSKTKVLQSNTSNVPKDYSAPQKPQVINKNSNNSNTNKTRTSQSSDSDDGQLRIDFPDTDLHNVANLCNKSIEGKLFGRELSDVKMERDAKSIRQIDSFLIDIMKIVNPHMVENDLLSREPQKESKTKIEAKKRDCLNTSDFIDKSVIQQPSKALKDESLSRSDECLSTLDSDESLQQPEQGMLKQREFEIAEEKAEVVDDNLPGILSHSSSYTNDQGRTRVLVDRINSEVSQSHIVTKESMPLAKIDYLPFTTKQKTSHVPLITQPFKAFQLPEINTRHQDEVKIPNIISDGHSLSNKKTRILSASSNKKDEDSVERTGKCTVDYQLPVADHCEMKMSNDSVLVNKSDTCSMKGDGCNENSPLVSNERLDNYKKASQRSPSSPEAVKAAQTQHPTNNEFHAGKDWHTSYINDSHKPTGCVDQSCSNTENNSLSMQHTKWDSVYNTKHRHHRSRRIMMSPNTLAQSLLQDISSSDAMPKVTGKDDKDGSHDKNIAFGFFDSVYNFLMKSIDKIKDSEDKDYTPSTRSEEDSEEAEELKEMVHPSESEVTEHQMINTEPECDRASLYTDVDGVKVRCTQDSSDVGTCDISAFRIINVPTESIETTNKLHHAPTSVCSSYKDECSLRAVPEAWTTFGRLESSSEILDLRNKCLMTSLPLDMSLPDKKSTKDVPVVSKTERITTATDVDSVGMAIESAKLVQGVAPYSPSGLNDIANLRKRIAEEQREDGYECVKKRREARYSLNDKDESLSSEASDGTAAQPCSEEELHILSQSNPHSRTDCPQGFSSKDMTRNPKSLLDFRFQLKKPQRSSGQKSDISDKYCDNAEADVADVAANSNVEDIDGASQSGQQNKKDISTQPRPASECNLIAEAQPRLLSSHHSPVISRESCPQGILVPYDDLLTFLIQAKLNKPCKLDSIDKETVNANSTTSSPLSTSNVMLHTSGGLAGMDQNALANTRELLARYQCVPLPQGVHQGTIGAMSQGSNNHLQSNNSDGCQHLKLVHHPQHDHPDSQIQGGHQEVVYTKNSECTEILTQYLMGMWQKRRQRTICQVSI